jgi:hypothetical protein
MAYWPDGRFNPLATPRKLRLRGTPARWWAYRVRKQLRMEVREAQRILWLAQFRLNAPVNPGKFERNIIVAQHWSEGYAP